MEKGLIISVFILTLINITDSLTNSVVTPSLVFYVTEVGGTMEQYGLISSIPFFSMMLMMSFYGVWVDSNGNKYKTPYAASFAFGGLGSILYFLAELLPSGAWAVYTILLGRFITGLGAAGRTLAYSYVATAIPRDQQRTILTILSLSRSIGMLLGPLMNLFVVKIDTSVSIFNYTIPLNPRNSAGLVLAAGELFLFILTSLLLQEPPPKKEKPLTEDAEPTKIGGKELFAAVTHFDLLFPSFIMFVLICNFTLYQVALPPVAADLFGWTPLEISYLMSIQAIVIFFGMIVAMYASVRGITDFTMIALGNSAFVFGGIATVLWWKRESATILQFIVSIVIVSFAYPLMGPANRSKFTRAVHSRPELEDSIGLLQSFFNQALSIGGFLSPNFVAKFVLKDTAAINSSDDGHELTPWAWYVSISALVVIAGLLYEEFILGKNELGLMKSEPAQESQAGETTPGETTRLLSGKRTSGKRRSSIVEINRTFNRKYEVDRRHSLETAGIPNPVDTAYERELQNQLTQDKQEWEKLLELDEEMEMTEE
mmetsp:Transcript_18115/g.30727  ORF Transcript_18115/g.30727 Transcript_18115/m.30727 type:complete len:542 (+) Transcript_18115:58-1683(+)